MMMGVLSRPRPEPGSPLSPTGFAAIPARQHKPKRLPRPHTLPRTEPIQALDRTAPILPMLPGVPQRATHDYTRHGTSSLFAALNITTGKVIGRLHARHRAVEFKQFLRTLDNEVPADLDVHVILDNSSTPK